ncbi:hypothetical protein BD626DRAFT_511339 [Schizophyllum amplum]|uniref:Secreted protein n=1 Tax=Schizophyllum amplum TaxID=97359 RepID=A0A550C155_9AGAR|nr:hypothetical protein BD626DRAFT_511339 [Auriculariopsis ampla]
MTHSHPAFSFIFLAFCTPETAFKELAWAWMVLIVRRSSVVRKQIREQGSHTLHSATADMTDGLRTWRDSSISKWCTSDFQVLDIFHQMWDTKALAPSVGLPRTSAPNSGRARRPYWRARRPSRFVQCWRSAN